MNKESQRAGLMKMIFGFLRWVGMGRLVRASGMPFRKRLRTLVSERGWVDFPYYNYDDEAEARKSFVIVKEHTMVSYERLVTLWQQVRYLDRVRIPGCLVECGTWKGGAVGMMALAHLAEDGEPFRSLHLFDSFIGLPEPDGAKDGEMAVKLAGGNASATLRSINKCVGSLEVNQHLLRDIVGYPVQLTHYHAGWFQETLPTVVQEIGPIALLRLDCDWYESVKVCLEALYPKVSSGGIVIIDDYGTWAGCRQAVDEFMGRLPRPLLLNHIDASGRYFIVP